MIKLRSKKQIEKMSKAGKILASCHKEIAHRIRPGISTAQIDAWVETYLERFGATPEQKDYMGYPYATCASINDEVCHGMPREKPLKNGDIVTIDMVVSLDGWLADSAWSYAIGEISKEAQRLLNITKKSLYIGIEKAQLGNRIGDISHAIQRYAESHNLGVVRNFMGHGIGTRIHEEPAVPHFGPPGVGPVLREGMVFTIEPMLTLEGYETRIQEDDGWTAKTVDGSLSAQYEHTIAITKDGPLILTEQ